MTETAVLDTNILVYSLYERDEHHRASRTLLLRAAEETGDLCVTPQTLAEFYAAVTNPRRVSAPKAPLEALAAIEAMLALPGLTLLPIPTDVIARLVILLRQRPVIGSDVFDVQLAATMLGNGVRKIYTFNTADFRAFDGIEAIRPDSADL